MPKFSERPQTLTESDFNFYLDKKIMLWYYKEINVANSKEGAVGHFYETFFRFLLKDKDTISSERESSVESEGSDPLKADCVLRCLKNNRWTKVVLCEYKRRDLRTQDSVWSEALKQVLRYANSIRDNEGQDREQTIYLNVTVGTHLRFYELPGRSKTAKDWAPAGGKLYELADDEEEVWALWQQIISLVEAK